MIKDHCFLKRHPWVMVAGILLLGIGLKVILLGTNRMPFNADEAIVGLMAAHILNGELPVFFWGQSYMGSFDALLVAGAFLVFGKSIIAIRLVQILLYCGTLITTYQLGYRIFGKVEAGWMVALLMAIPTVNVTLYTTISLGGYGEALLIGNLILLSCLRIIDKNTWYDWLIMGLLSGVGVWVNGLTLVYSIPAVCIACWKLINQLNSRHNATIARRLSILIVAAILGALPWWIYGTHYGFHTLVSELLGSAIANPEVGYLGGLGKRIISFLLFGLTVIFGFRPPWEVRWLVLPLIPLVTAVWILILIGFQKLMKVVQGLSMKGVLLWAIILILLAGFILTSFGNDPSGRYFLPLSVPLSIIAGGYLSLAARLGRWRWGVLSLLILYNLGGTVQCWQNYPPGFTTQFDASTIYDHRYQGELIHFLEENSIERGYTTYWVAYPLAFLSEERLIFVPRLPYHSNFNYTERDDRYMDYGKLVSGTQEIAYITAREPWLDNYIRERFEKLDLKWQESTVGDFTIFYQLSRFITPQEIGLGESTD
jgi:4-amino-4-deoxy-L-arabinose transferase-like glycosyltransferase